MRVAKAHRLRQHGTRHLEAAPARDDCCPVCGKPITLTKGGKVRTHNDRQGVECPGSTTRLQMSGRYHFDELPPVDLTPRPGNRRVGKANPWSGKA